MTWDPEEISRKLSMIATLSAGELAGWHRYATSWREPFHGEIAALTSRAQKLGIDLPAKSSRAGPSGSATVTPD